MSPAVELPDAEGPRVLVVQNSPTSHAGRLLDWFKEAGVVPVVLAGSELPATLDGYGGLVTLGGGFMPDADDHAPWLPHERRLTVQSLQREVPLLGICLGAQLLALCAGGEVTERSGETERGSCSVDLLPVAADDPVFGGFADEGRLLMIQNHSDSITALPAGADLLATSEVCRVQAFRVGVCAWGVQFHPEVGPERLAQWDEAALAADGYDRVALMESAEADADDNERQSRGLVTAFADVIRAAALRTEV